MPPLFLSPPFTSPSREKSECDDDDDDDDEGGDEPVFMRQMKMERALAVESGRPDWFKSQVFDFSAAKVSKWLHLFELLSPHL